MQSNEYQELGVYNYNECNAMQNSELFLDLPMGDLSSDTGSLNRATGEKVTESQVNCVFRGTHNRQSVLGSWGPSAAREGRPKGDITPLTSSCIPPIIILFLILSLFLRTGGGLSSKRERETEVTGRNEVSVPYLCLRG